MNVIKAFVRHHPRLASWIVLAVGMTALFLLAARGQGMTARQIVLLALVTIGVAGLCAWIIGWEPE